MSKHDRAKIEKSERNSIYALRYKRRKCEECGHKSSRRDKCKVCGGRMRGSR